LKSRTILPSLPPSLPPYLGSDGIHDARAVGAHPVGLNVVIELLGVHLEGGREGGREGREGGREG